MTELGDELISDLVVRGADLLFHLLADLHREVAQPLVSLLRNHSKHTHNQAFNKANAHIKGDNQIKVDKASENDLTVLSETCGAMLKKLDN